MAATSKCPVQKQAIAIARSGREEWRDREREHEQRHYENDDNRDIYTVCSDEAVEEMEEVRVMSDNGSENLEMEIEEKDLTCNVEGGKKPECL